MSEYPAHPLRLFNSLTRQLEEFVPVHDGEARIYTCGPTVYNYQHIGNMRAYIFADLLGRTMSWKGLKLTHIINITDVGHLTSDADAGDDKMEKAAAASGKTAWDIARYYTDAYWADIDRLNIRQPAKWTIATDHVEEMIEFAKGIADKHCYECETGLYFDTTTVPDYGRLAGARSDDIEGRIDEVEGKRHPQDFAIWRKTPPGENRQMEWDSPWGKGAPGWHLECSQMSMKYLGNRFDIHTGGIDHREIHHPNEIAQNQAHNCSEHSGANIWMHNNFLIDRAGKMSKSSGDFLRLQVLVDRGIHPLAYRLMCLQAHYRSELEFTWDNLVAALTRLKRIVMGVENLRQRAADMDPAKAGDREHPKVTELRDQLDAAMSDDLNSPKAIPLLEELLSLKKVNASQRLNLLADMDAVLGLDLEKIQRADLRVRPANAPIEETDIEAALDRRQQAKSDKDFAAADAVRDELTEQGVELMDGDPLRWEWRIVI
ncbi:cysteinyl-tRNA synthetase [Parasphingorhabdus marina DSM 22363]|uniref:Cysteine--tRNA ligase n=1 Tax=Parasphingorhabdus marina DSM 22363 TaxID=1123272 RepID=A0A1N6GZA1_9SPHN|nr:cysteine--tRNA ligase [Parasphingorhabdus marina]SIO12860.1 cysteinyl-tRNA synthetase [Parasphingorhabdus marina DSM 22363]